MADETIHWFAGVDWGSAPFDAEQFPQQLQELLALSRQGFPPGHPFATVRVIPMP